LICLERKEWVLTKEEAGTDPLKPLLTLLVKLGSIVIHADEYLSPEGHPFDRQALVPLIRDPEVEKWIAAMHKQCFLPQKRNPKSQAIPEGPNRSGF
jgi:hypothetical protein